MGEDTCVFEEENPTEASQSDCEEGHVEPEVCRNIGMLVDKISVGLEEAAINDFQGKSDVEFSDKLECKMSGEGESEWEGERTVDILSPVSDQVEVQSTIRLGPQGDDGDRDSRTDSLFQKSESQDCPTTRRTFGNPNRMPETRCTLIVRILALQRRTALSREIRREGVMGCDTKRWGSYNPRGGKQEDCSATRFTKGVNRSCVESRHATSEESSSSDSINNDWKNWWLYKEMTSEKKQEGEIRSPDGGRFEGEGMLDLWRQSCKFVRIFSARNYGGTHPIPSLIALCLEHVLWCHGRFTKSGEEFSVANVYAPCDDGAKQGLWDSLSARIQSLGRRTVCVCGDFNVVKQVDERRSSRGGSRSLDHIPFNRFIVENNLIDLPLSGRKFTWFKRDGLSMSRLDKFLLSEEWCLVWPNCKQTAILRGLSDHCSLVLSANEEDWEPRPSRMLKCWRDVPRYQVFVKDKWKSLQVDGWGGYVLKEKLRMIKATLKDWHMTHTQNLPSRIESLKNRLSTLDQKGEEEVLSEAEIAELHRVSSDIHSLSHGITLEGVVPIRQAVISHFASHFKAIHVERPGVDNLQFTRLNQVESSSFALKTHSEQVYSKVAKFFTRKGDPRPNNLLSPTSLIYLVSLTMKVSLN
ncbi:hypothetical protein TSUD_98840 [Trifolium subterraneum]|uniref:Endonuclease/exonuclease/phosphatase domain-containing protein n=1 Tax=Trifolium subterraneum TaxID=3900 RepID=A0A2Z6P2Y0_TRISU|nr:hypothetical protein TSUD_98840 [Trifolium subterraneum]